MCGCEGNLGRIFQKYLFSYAGCLAGDHSSDQPTPEFVYLGLDFYQSKDIEGSEKETRSEVGRRITNSCKSNFDPFGIGKIRITILRLLWHSGIIVAVRRIHESNRVRINGVVMGI